METDIQQIQAVVEKEAPFVEKLTGQISSVIVGQKYLIERLLIGILSNGHILIEGVPGLAKTLSVSSLAQSIQAKFQRLQFTPDLLPADLIGTMIYNPQKAEFSVKKGPIFANIILADEINRFPPKAQNAFIEALAEGSITIGNETYKLEQPFFCLATQNPTEQKGTSRIQEALADRFMFKLIMEETTEAEKIEIARRTHHFDLSNLEKVINTKDVYDIREYLFDNTFVSDPVRKYMARLLYAVNHPDKCDLFEEEISTIGGNLLFKQKPALNDRSMLHLEGAAMMEAAMEERFTNSND